MPLVHKNNFFNYYKITQVIKHLAKKTANNKKNVEFHMKKKKRKKKKEPINV